MNTCIGHDVHPFLYQDQVHTLRFPSLTNTGWCVCDADGTQSIRNFQRLMNLDLAATLHWETSETPFLAVLHKDHLQYLVGIYTLAGHAFRHFYVPDSIHVSSKYRGHPLGYELFSHPVCRELLLVIKLPGMFRVVRFDFHGVELSRWDAPLDADHLISHDLAFHPTRPWVWFSSRWNDVRLYTHTGVHLLSFSLPELRGHRPIDLRVWARYELLIVYSLAELYFYSFNGRLLYRHELDFYWRIHRFCAEDQGERLQVAIAGQSTVLRLTFE